MPKKPTLPKKPTDAETFLAAGFTPEQMLARYEKGKADGNKEWIDRYGAVVEELRAKGLLPA